MVIQVSPVRKIPLVIAVLACALFLLLPVAAVTLTPGSSLASAATISNGDSVFIQGIATGHPQQGLQVWIMGPNYLKASTVSVNADNTYAYELKPADTMQLASGQYYVLVQHPMMNGRFDVVYNTGTGQIINRQLGTGGTTIFQLSGSGSLQSSDAAFALARAISSQNIDDSFAPTGFSISPPIVPIDPIGDHMVGDRFTISGSTNLAVGDELSITVISSSFGPTLKSQSGEFSGAAGIVKVIPGSGGLNRWSFGVDTSTWKPDEYAVTVEGVTVDVQESTLFNVLEYRPTSVAPSSTVVTTPVSPTGIPTILPTAAPPVTRSPLPAGVVMGAVAGAALIVAKRRE
jgi:trimeric autotransporter adhesin